MVVKSGLGLSISWNQLVWVLKTRVWVQNTSDHKNANNEDTPMSTAAIGTTVASELPTPQDQQGAGGEGGHLQIPQCLHHTGFIMVLSRQYLDEESLSASLPPQTPKRLQPLKVLKTFYTCTVQSILTGSITIWFGSSTKRVLPGPAEGCVLSRMHHQMSTLSPMRHLHQDM